MLLWSQNRLKKLQSFSNGPNMKPVDHFATEATDAACARWRERRRAESEVAAATKPKSATYKLS